MRNSDLGNTYMSVGGDDGHSTTYMRVGGDDGELRPWHYIYQGRRGRWKTPTTAPHIRIQHRGNPKGVGFRLRSPKKMLVHILRDKTRFEECLARGNTCEDRVLDGPASGVKGSKGKN